MRPGVALSIAMSLASLTGLGASTAYADDAQVTVVTAGGDQQTLSLEALGAGDVAARAYALRSAEGESTATVSGFSPAAILEAAGIDPFAFSYLEVQRAAGGSVLLSRDQALDPASFPEGPPVIYATATGTGFLRPSTGGGDLNATDSFEAPQGITLVLRNGSPLRVRAEASTLRTRTGNPVIFTAVVDRAGAGERLTYSWYFDDGSSSTGSRARHRFSKRGTYDVVVGVTTPADDAGASAVVTVQVGPPLAGPDRKGGGANESSDAPDHGAATGGGTSQPARVRSRHCPHTRRGCDRDEGSAHRRKAMAPVGGEPVSGLPLSGAEAPRTVTPAAAARIGKLDQQGSGPGLPGTALGLTIAVGLLGAGALTELRR
jgi:hypothetical protein